ncbi:alpha/beta hydrolase [Limnohabitans sp. 2KL-1]|uniref:YheT family hydrolase n=1 Tax=Limnohabitans sp. 2KL-1 TaxID=1100699 RepID=UPI000D38C906|nr:alpha/beta fold hydrolase [Limnohabitans sp. 2KL-1]PUE50538.1 alpha/beta hydrolase [Limnohabitans sp. 2KL-1]
MQYCAPAWLPGGHAQTIWAALYARRRLGVSTPFQRERWTTPDGDFVDVDRQLASQVDRPLLVLFHGLEGSSQSHYAQAFADWAVIHDVHFAVPHFRGCSGELNHAPRANHSGDHQEIDWLLQNLAEQHRASGGKGLVATGISLGGNALMRWAAERGDSAAHSADAVASICSPLDLMQSGQAIGQGFNRQVYTRMFLRTMKRKALAKLAQYPGLFDRQALLAARDLYEFDNVFTAPLHGFESTEDYWTRASAKPLMSEIRIPALAVNALNDPFIPASSLPQKADISAMVTLWQPAHGGHVGFPEGSWPGHVCGLPERVGRWLLTAAGLSLKKTEKSDG